jgi:hypothetical protein
MPHLGRIKSCSVTSISARGRASLATTAAREQQPDACGLDSRLTRVAKRVDSRVWSRRLVNGRGSAPRCMAGGSRLMHVARHRGSRFDACGQAGTRAVDWVCVARHRGVDWVRVARQAPGQSVGCMWPGSRTVGWVRVARHQGSRLGAGGQAAEQSVGCGPGSGAADWVRVPRAVD